MTRLLSCVVSPRTTSISISRVRSISVTGWDMGVDAFPNIHLVAKADAKDLAPENV